MQTITGNKQTDLELIKFLSYQDVLRLCTTNKYMAALCRDDQTWRIYLQGKFPSITNKTFTLGSKGMYIYPTWRNYAEVIFTNAKVFKIPLRTLGPAEAFEMKQRQEENDGEFEKDDISRLNAVARPFTPNIRRGDIVHFYDMGIYRNDGRFIYNGYYIEDLDYTEDIDGYGFLPIEYSLEEFIDPSRWASEHQIEHNSIIWANFSNGVYQKIESNPNYLIFRRDNLYYTIIADEDNFGQLDLTTTTFTEESNVYYFDVDYSRHQAAMYNSIRDKVRGYVLIVRS